MNRFIRRYRAGSALLASTLLGLGGASGLLHAPQAQAANNNMTCRASVLRITGKALPIGTIEPAPLVANAQNDPCRTQSAGLLNLGLPTGPGDHVSVASAQTTSSTPGATCAPPDPNCAATAGASARVLEAQVGGTLLKASVLTADANQTQPVERCPDGSIKARGPVTRTGDSHVAQVTINGTVIEVPTDKSDPAHPTLAIPGVLTLFLREEISTPDKLTERALELQTPLLDVVISEASVDDEITDNGPCTGDRCIDINTVETSTTETDPFVNPWAEETFGQHPDCADEFSVPQGNGDNDAHDFVHFVRSINDTETSPDGAFVPDNPMDDSSGSDVEKTLTRNRFNGKAGFFEDGDTTPSIEGDIYDDEDMNFRLSPLTIDAYLAPNDLAASPWRRFCGTGVIMPLDSDGDGLMDDGLPTAPFETGQVRKFLIETFDAKFLNPEFPGGDQTDYFVIDIYAPGSDFDTQQCDPAVGDRDHDDASNPNRDTLDYHSEGKTIAGNIEIHTERVEDADNDDTTPM